METNKPNAPQGESLYPNHPGFQPDKQVPVGGTVQLADPIAYNTGRPTVKLAVRNTGDRPIQVGSHYHFFEVNRYLEFDREAAFGCHLNIPATTAIRFEPGDQKEVELVPFAGKRRIIGFNGLVMGYAGSEDTPVYYPARMKALRRVRKAGFKVLDEASSAANLAEMERKQAAGKASAEAPKTHPEQNNNQQ